MIFICPIVQVSHNNELIQMFKDKYLLTITAPTQKPTASFSAILRNQKFILTLEEKLAALG